MTGDTNNKDDIFVHGAPLTLDASAKNLNAGDTLTLTTYTGLAGAPVWLSVLRSDRLGALMYLRGRFDGAGHWATSTTVPRAQAGMSLNLLRGMAGLSLQLQAFGIAPDGTLGRSNKVTVTIQ